MKAPALVATAAVAGMLAGCSTATTAPAAPSTAITPTAPGPALTGFGATLAQWQAAHKLDRSVPARNAYLPHTDGNGEDTWQIVMVAGGRVISYTLNVAPSTLSAAEARARQELPADARVLWKHRFGGTCAQEQFRVRDRRRGTWRRPGQRRVRQRRHRNRLAGNRRAL